jgi:hypothetical protein
MSRFKVWLTCFFGGHDWRASEPIEDHIAGTGWYQVCSRCRKWRKL